MRGTPAPKSPPYDLEVDLRDWHSSWGRKWGEAVKGGGGEWGHVWMAVRRAREVQVVGGEGGSLDRFGR